MLKREKVLLGITIGVAVLDMGLACSTYAKKKGIVLRDMVLSSIDELIHGKKETDGEAVAIPIE